MQKSQPTAGFEGANGSTALQERIEDLAVQVVIDEVAESSRSSLASTLDDIRAHALREGYSGCARIAETLADTTRTCRDLASLQESLVNGVGELQTTAKTELPSIPADPPPVGMAPAKSAEAPPANPLAQDPESLSDFVVESREHLAAIESQSLVLEQEPGNADAINAVFRGFHTIKGLAGFLEQTTVLKVSHEIETVLDLARNGKLPITPPLIDLVLETADSVSRSIQVLDAQLRGAALPEAPNHQTILEHISSFMRGEQPRAKVGEGVSEASSAVDHASLADTSDDPPVSAGTPLAASPAAEEVRNDAASQTAGTFSVRVDAGKLDYLMDMVGEMVIAQSLLRHEPAFANIQNPRVLGNLSQLARATSEVQKTAMAMRMVPIGNLFQKMARLVRDLSRKMGKPVNFETSGDDTALDKTIAEELADPLMHMVRNSLDHGIEEPAARKAAGKNPAGCVRLSAYHQSGQIVVEVSDDGGGLNRGKILNKARKQGLCHDGELTDTEVFNLIFAPGFSTAEQVTSVSGRGVGMDVVRTHVEKLRGRIDVESTLGQGTRFVVKLPLTLAIIDGLIVGVGEYRYIVPIFSVKEMFRPTPGQISTIQGRNEMARVRNVMLPIARLHRCFRVQPRTEDPCEALLIVAETEGKQFCLMVDELIGKQEVVIKSLGEMLKNVSGVAGGAILGDGRVGLILDMAGIFRSMAHE